MDILFDPNSPVFANPAAGWVVLSFVWFAVIYFLGFFALLIQHWWKDK